VLTAQQATSRLLETAEAREALPPVAAD
jgi:hypothetical protein